MIREILRKVECFISRRYSKLYLEHNRIVDLYSQGGITKSIANRELYSIYSRMKQYKNLSRHIILFKVKLQTLLIG